MSPFLLKSTFESTNAWNTSVIYIYQRSHSPKYPSISNPTLNHKVRLKIESIKHSNTSYRF